MSERLKVVVCRKHAKDILGEISENVFLERFVKRQFQYALIMIANRTTFILQFDNIPICDSYRIILVISLQNNTSWRISCNEAGIQHIRYSKPFILEYTANDVKIIVRISFEQSCREKGIWIHYFEASTISWIYTQYLKWFLSWNHIGESRRINTLMKYIFILPAIK